MKRIPGWVWPILGIVILVSIGYRGMMQAQYYKGIADAAAEESARQSELITEAQARTDSLLVGLDELTILASKHAIEDSIRKIELTTARSNAKNVSDSLSIELASRLDSVQVRQLENLIVSHQIEIQTLTEAIELEAGGRRIEALRADRASNVVIQLQMQITQMEERDSTRSVEIIALREATSGLSLSVKAGWLTGAGGVVLGYALATVLNR